MSSVPCARERAELVRAWWVTASGSGVAICGDTGKKLDRPVPAGFETVPQGIRVNLRVRDASGITTKASNRTHDVRRASRTPLIAPGRKPVEGFVLGAITRHRFPRIYSGAQWRFRCRLNRAPARGPGEAEQMT